MQQANPQASAPRRPYDVVVLGCGFYGQRVAAELLCLLGQEYRVAIARRHSGKLQAAREAVLALAAASQSTAQSPSNDDGAATPIPGAQQQLGRGVEPPTSQGAAAMSEPRQAAAADSSSATQQRQPAGQLPLSEDALGVVGGCDAGDPVAMASLAESTTVLLACLPNYRAVGETVVRACAEAGTHYFDLSVETDLHQRWRRLYGGQAAAAGALIVPCCGYDYVVADFGVQLAKGLVASPTSVECYTTVQPGSKGIVLRESTFHDLLERAGTPTPPEGGLCYPQCAGPARRRGPPLLWTEPVGRWSLLGPQSEEDVVSASQQHLHSYQAGGSSPSPAVSFTSRVTLPSLLMAGAVAGGMALLALARIPPLRRVMAAAAPPMLRRLGLLTADNARYQEFIQQVTVEKLFVVQGRASGAGLHGSTKSGSGSGSGGSSSGLGQGAGEEEEQAALRIVGSGYRITPAAMALAAATVLQQRGRCCAQGFATPLAAFHHTDYWERLCARSGIVVEVVVVPGGEGCPALAQQQQQQRAVLQGSKEE